MVGLTVGGFECPCGSREVRIEVPDAMQPGQHVTLAMRCANSACGRSVVHRDTLVEELADDGS